MKITILPNKKDQNQNRFLICEEVVFNTCIHSLGDLSLSLLLLVKQKLSIKIVIADLLSYKSSGILHLFLYSLLCASSIIYKCGARYTGIHIMTSQLLTFLSTKRILFNIAIISLVIAPVRRSSG